MKRAKIFSPEIERKLAKIEKVRKLFNQTTYCILKGIDYLRVLFFIIEPRSLKFGMRI